MKRLKAKYIVLILILISFGCQKIIQNNDDPPQTITVGIYDSTMIHKVLPTPLSIPLSWDPTNVEKKGNISLSIPLSSSDTVNLTFSLCIVDQDSLDLVPDSLLDLYYSYSAVGCQGGFKVKHITESYGIGFGHYVEFNYVEPLQFEALIKENKMIKCSELNFWEILPKNNIPPGNGHLGPWISTTGIKYMGFLYKSHMGWIKIDNSVYTNPKIVEYAVQK